MPQALFATPACVVPLHTRRQAHGNTPAVLAHIHDQDVNLAVWQRAVPARAAEFVAHLLAEPSPVSERLTVALPDDEPCANLSYLLQGHRSGPGYAAFVEDLTWLVEAYACLLGVRRVGLRLRSLEKAMCPRFHVDKVPVRLLTTYQGPGTEWLPTTDARPRQLVAGDVALLKGEHWLGNEGHGIAHRSPGASAEQPRLVLTLDWLE